MLQYVISVVPNLLVWFGTGQKLANLIIYTAKAVNNFCSLNPRNYLVCSGTTSGT